MPKKKTQEELDPAMGRDPLSDDEEILATTFYGSNAKPARREPAPAPAPRKTKRTRRAAAPTHYKVVSISLYNEDIERIDQMVAELKEMGHTKANRSALIRFAIDTCDIAKMPKSY